LNRTFIKVMITPVTTRGLVGLDNDIITNGTTVELF